MGSHLFILRKNFSSYIFLCITQLSLFLREVFVVEIGIFGKARSGKMQHVSVSSCGGGYCFSGFLYGKYFTFPIKETMGCGVWNHLDLMYTKISYMQFRSSFILKWKVRYLLSSLYLKWYLRFLFLWLSWNFHVFVLQITPG